MAYADRRSLRERSTGIAGVVVVHVGLAALVVLGLSTEVTREIITGPFIAKNIPKTPPPPPPLDEPKPKPDQAKPETVVFTPPMPKVLPRPDILETKPLPPIIPELPTEFVPTPKVETPGPKFKPVAATPRNDPGRWVTDSDYRSRWINEEMSGTARFTLDVDGTGRVSNCQITQSTGYAELDAATCALIAKRAKFKPAKDGNGNPATGSYSSSIRWQLPE